MLRTLPPAALALLWLAVLAGCSREPAAVAQTPPPYVRTVSLTALGEESLALSGVVRARQEAPLAFQVGGRIMSRHADAGDVVGKGQLLFRLDPRDLAAAHEAAQADLAAAEAALATTVADRERAAALHAQDFVNRQAVERALLAEREAQTRVAAARARALQAANALGYGELRAPASGVLVEVSGEPGQVVAPGQAMATLAHSGEREIEVFLPEAVLVPRERSAAGAVRAPVAGEATFADGRTARLALRELAGAADTRSRSWRARYRVLGGSTPLLGSVVRVRLESTGGGPGAAGSGIAPMVFDIPLAALDERGGGPRVWLVADGKVQAQPVQLLSLAGETARIAAALPSGAHIVALGTHLLQPGMAVRELRR